MRLKIHGGCDTVLWNGCSVWNWSDGKKTSLCLWETDNRTKWHILLYDITYRLGKGYEAPDKREKTKISLIPSVNIRHSWARQQHRAKLIMLIYFPSCTWRNKAEIRCEKALYTAGCSSPCWAARALRTQYREALPSPAVFPSNSSNHVLRCSANSFKIQIDFKILLCRCHTFAKRRALLKFCPHLLCKLGC